LVGLIASLRATLCNSLQLNATRCNSLQLNATHVLIASWRISCESMARCGMSKEPYIYITKKTIRT